MPHDSPTTPRESSHRPAGLPSARWVVLAALIGATSLAVGATTNPWLIPPYLAAMGWLLLTPARPRLTIEAPSGEALAPIATADECAPAESRPSPAPSEEAIEPAPKPKKPRSRAKAKPKVKEAPPAVPAMVATWVQIAPGKFVRVEVPAPTEPTPEPDCPPSEVVEEAQVVAADEPAIGPKPVEPAVPEPVAEESSPDVHEPIPSPREWRELPPPVLEIIATDSQNDRGFEESPSEPDRFDEVADREPEDDRGFEGPPERSRLVALGDSDGPKPRRLAAARSVRIRRDPRPRLRRGNGRVGAMPRVVLHRG